MARNRCQSSFLLSEFRWAVSATGAYVSAHTEETPRDRQSEHRLSQPRSTTTRVYIWGSTWRTRPSAESMISTHADVCMGFMWGPRRTYDRARKSPRAKDFVIGGEGVGTHTVLNSVYFYSPTHMPTLSLLRTPSLPFCSIHAIFFKS